jgi:hypothetical protein
MAPRRRRSLLRRQPRALGAALRPDTASTRKRHQTPRPEQRAPSGCQARRPSPARTERAPAVATLLCVAVLGLWGSSAARADEVPPPPATTVPDAPPPDPYKAPPRPSTPKAVAPRRVAPVRSSPRAYTPAPAPAPVVRAPRVKPKRHVPVVRKHRAPAKRHVAPKVSLAPVSHVLAATRISVPVATGSSQHPYLWLSGISFAVLAVAGTGLLLLAQRTFRTEWE